MERRWSLLAGKSRAALHAKSLVFDRKSVFIGSFNLDPRSSTLNTEVGVMIDSPEIASQVAKIMDAGVSPGSAYHVTLDKDDNLVWTAENNGKRCSTTKTREPTYGRGCFSTSLAFCRLTTCCRRSWQVKGAAMFSVEAKLAERPQDYRWSSYASYLKGKGGGEKSRLFRFRIETVPPQCNSDEAVGATDLRRTGDQKG